MNEYDPLAQREGVSREGLAAARRYSRWHLGHECWADAILEAYLDPARAIDRLEKERGRA